MLHSHYSFITFKTQAFLALHFSWLLSPYNWQLQNVSAFRAIEKYAAAAASILHRKFVIHSKLLWYFSAPEKKAITHKERGSKLANVKKTRRWKDYLPQYTSCIQWKGTKAETSRKKMTNGTRKEKSISPLRRPLRFICVYSEF